MQPAVQAHSGRALSGASLVVLSRSPKRTQLVHMLAVYHFAYPRLSRTCSSCEVGFTYCSSLQLPARQNRKHYSLVHDTVAG